jgi:OmpA-OmpF porin, OOP family
VHLRKYPLLFLLCFVLAIPGLQAQELSYEEQLNLRAPTWTGETGLFTGITGDTLRRGDWSFSIYFNDFDYLVAPLPPQMRIPTRRSFREMDIEETRLSASIGYGITDRWEFVASIPYINLENNAGDLTGFVAGYPRAGRFDESGIGNLHLATKFGLIDPAASDSRLALSLFVDLATGDEDVTTGNSDYGIGLHWNRGIWSFGGQYRVIGDRDESDMPAGWGSRFAMSDEIRLDAGLNVPLRWWAYTNWISEINAIFYSGGDAKPDNPIYLVTGLRHWFGTSGWGLSAALRANATMLTSDSNACPYGGLVGLHFAPIAFAAVAPPPPAPVPIPPPPPAPVPPPPEPVAPPPAPQEIRLDEIHFEPGSARLTNIAKAILDDVALRMRQEPRATAIVIGYTDDRENTGANRDLDRRRAEAVRDYLVSRHGIDPTRISVEGRGTMDAVGDNTTAEGRLRNRRAVIRLLLQP